MQVIVNISIAALTSYNKLSIAVQLHCNEENRDTSLFLSGAITQLGSLTGALLFFILVYFTNIFHVTNLTSFCANG